MTSMPYRQPEFSELCTDCKAEATSACPRCGRPLCEQHAPPDDLRCVDCEATFDHSIRRNSRLSVAFGLVLWLTAMVLIAVAPSTRFWARMFLMVLIAGAPVMVGAAVASNKLLYAGQRQRFLGQRKFKELPASTSTNDAASEEA